MLAEQFDLTGLGAAGILVVLILRMVFDFLKSKAPPAPLEPRLDLFEELTTLIRAQTEILRSIESRTDVLYRWHAPNEDGRQTWKLSDDVLERLQATLDRIEAKLDILRK